MSWTNSKCGNTVEEVVTSKSGLSVDELLNPKKNDAHNIENLCEAANKIKSAISNGTHITIVGDYDADGVTSTSILLKTFRALNADVSFRLPRRISEGYGISRKIIDEISDGLIVTVDNGISAVEEIALARSKGLDVIVLDHHLPDDELPEALIVDAHIHPDNNGFENYCGAGLAYKLSELLIADETLLRENEVLAAIGTIADVVSLTGDNRVIVKNGLEFIRTKKHLPLGLAQLIDAIGLNNFSEKDIAFKIAPVFNAPGRMFDDGAKIAVLLLTSEDKSDIDNIINQMIELNTKRQEEVAEATKKAENAIVDNAMFLDVPLCIKLPDVHEGVVGIVTGKLAEKYKRPTFVFTKAKDETLKASGRSYGNVNLKELLGMIEPDILLRSGGHAGAAGLSLNEDMYDKFVNQIQACCKGYEVSEEHTYDILIKSEKDLPNVYKELRKFAPYGEGVPTPIFRIENTTLSPRYGSYCKFMGKNGEHLKLSGNGYSAVCFGMTEKYKEMACPRIVTLTGYLTENKYMNYAPELQIEALDIEKNEKGNSVVGSSLLGALRANGTI